MGKRRRLAALGATFALLVAACATTDTPLANAPELSLAPRPSTSVVGGSPDPIAFPDSLADASFVQPDTSGDTCRSEHPAQVTLLSSATGEQVWSFPIPEPGSLSEANNTTAFLTFRSDRGQAPGIGALDLSEQAPLWQRFFETEAHDLALTEDRLIVVTRDAVRALDLETGADLWVNDSQFDFDNVILTDDVAYALDSVGVKAIDYASGRVLWTLNDVERVDTMSYASGAIAVAAQTRMVAIDTEARGRLWDIDHVDRLGAGEVWTTPTAVFYELSPNAAPGGGVTALDRATGEELWSAKNVGTPAFIGTGQLITSTASAAQPPAEPFVLIGLDAATGEELWRLTSTAQVFDGVVGSTEGQVIISDPHPVAPGFFRIRLVNSVTGEVQWHTQSAQRFEGAEFDLGAFVALYGTTQRSTGDRGNVSLVLGSERDWTADLSGGVAQPPQLTAEGLLVASPSQFSCIGRLVVEPGPTIGAGVLGATTERSLNG